MRGELISETTLVFLVCLGGRAAPKRKRRTQHTVMVQAVCCKILDTSNVMASRDGDFSEDIKSPLVPQTGWQPCISMFCYMNIVFFPSAQSAILKVKIRSYQVLSAA